jgi:hypothetical protein
VEGLVNLEVTDRRRRRSRSLEGSVDLGEPLEVVAALEAELELILSTQIQSSHQVVVQLVDHLLRVH